MTRVGSGLLVVVLLATATLSTHIALQHLDRKSCQRAVRYAQFAEFGTHYGSNVASYFQAVDRGARLRWSAEIIGRWPAQARVYLHVDGSSRHPSEHAWVVTLGDPGDRRVDPNDDNARELCRSINAWSRQMESETRRRPRP